MSLLVHLVLDHRQQRPAAAVLLDQDAPRLLEYEVVEPHDRRVPDHGGDARLAHQRPDRVPPLVVGHPSHLDHLCRESSSRFSMPHRVHDAEGTLTQLLGVGLVVLVSQGPRATLAEDRRERTADGGVQLPGHLEDHRGKVRVPRGSRRVVVMTRVGALVRVPEGGPRDVPGFRGVLRCPLRVVHIVAGPAASPGYAGRAPHRASREFPVSPSETVVRWGHRGSVALVSRRRACRRSGPDPRWMCVKFWTAPGRDPRAPTTRRWGCSVGWGNTRRGG